MASTPQNSNPAPSPSTPTPTLEKRITPPAFSSPLASRFSPQTLTANDPSTDRNHHGGEANRFSPQTPTAKNPSTDRNHHVGVPLSSFPRASPPTMPHPQTSSSPSPLRPGSEFRASPYQILNGSKESPIPRSQSQSPEITTVSTLQKQHSSPGISQFNTPPGPPLFSSPSRPANPAAPFSPMMPLPQPAGAAPHFSDAPFASPRPKQPGALLPTSSLPTAYSNGTPEPQPIDTPDLDNSSLVAASPYVLFSAHKVLKQKKLSSNSSIGFGALVSLGRETMPGPQTVQHNPYRCQNCGAYVNLYCSIVPSTGEWKCVICKKLNSSEAEYRAASREDLRNWPELSSSVVDYVETSTRRPGFVPVSDSRMSAPVILVIDECLDEPHLQHLQSSLHAFVDSLPPTTRIGIVTYGRTVSVYDFSESGLASADMLPGSKSPSQESLKTMIFGTGVYLAPLHASLNVAHNVFSSLRPFRGDQPEVARDRCLGTAVEIALALIQGPSAEMSRGTVKRSGGNSRILVCAGGPNTFGPGCVPHSLSHPNYAFLEKKALKWMEHLGREARRHDTVVDILCAGTCPVRIPILQPLAKASGGVLILHDDFGEAFGVNLQRAAKRAAGSQGIFEVRCSDDIFVSQIIGPGEEAHSDSHETFKNDSAVSIQMLSVEDTQSFAVIIDLKKDIKENHAFFQFAACFTDVYQSNITRVITLRLPTTDAQSAYIDSIEGDVAAVLIGKRAVLQARNSSDAVDIRLAIDERVKDITTKFGTQLPKVKLRRFPKELSVLPEYLFHLRRGPLLGGIIGHEDERSVLRNLFLQASFDLSLRMLAPRVLMHRDGGTFEELPAYDLAMQSDAAVVLDHGTDVFIWLGADLAVQEGKSAAALAACRTLAEELTEQRFPAPRILSFKEGSSQARYFVSRLIPAHKDPPYEQEARFPQLRTLSPEQRAKLKSSFLHVDDFSFCEWMRSMKLVPPEPS
uniref:TSA: Wollemia nobilis Ref_Wollemi_Transcript_12856_3701 transcribed RNA sequence n=1 Tax=Wollemia nobilis TaxID=56998 RepID=A0A0C9S7S5_9CONI